ncbi:MAG: PA0069 family radical SAM protein [Cyclobacteriaceae bacterium]|nr:PA0069 family radical SAM protein [Cyclobacteriaceae bacterium]
MDDSSYLKGRGSQIKPANKFLKAEFVTEHIEGIDEDFQVNPQTQVFIEHPRKIINPVNSPDLGMAYSMNPYQGCEHGCIYCYARNTHEYYGFSAGLDFESRIVAKTNAAATLQKQLSDSSWKVSPIMLSGNTDCYQPLERRMQLTRGMLKVLARFRHPVGIITKNGLITRDIDILKDLAADRLVQVMISITTLDEDLRRAMEPRTSIAIKRLKTVEQLAKENIPVGIMNAPIIPGLNHHEIPEILRLAAEHGAMTAGMTVVRLNGAVAKIFEDWLHKNFPDRFAKVWNQISSMHGGQVSDSTFGRRMAGEGNLADIIHQLYRTSKNKYFQGRKMPAMDITHFRRGGNLSLF